MDIRKLTEINVLFKPDLILITLYVLACYETRTGVTNWHQNLSFALDATEARFPYTFEGGLPRIRLHTARFAI